MGMVTQAMDGVGSEPGAFGKRIMELAERLAQWSEISDGLTCTYLSPAHRSVAAEIRNWMRQAGLITEIDAVANVVGRYAAPDPAARTLIVASHYDTVRNAGKYDGRLGVDRAGAGRAPETAWAQVALSSRRHRILGGRGGALFVKLSWQPRGGGAVRRQTARTARRRRPHVGGGHAGCGPRSSEDSRARAPPRGADGISRSPHRARPGFARGGAAGRDRERDCRLRSLDRHDHRSRRPCPRRADGAAAAGGELVL